MNWTEEFIGQVLADVPAGRYRERTGKELQDHMETLRQSCSEEEVLRLMGDPERLRGEYRAAWSRTLEGRFRAIIDGCLVMGALYLLTGLILSWIGFTMDAEFMEPHTLTGQNFPILGHPLALAIYASALFLGTFPLGALYLRSRFRDARRPVVWVTLGLLAAWAGEKAVIIGLSALIYQMPLGPDLLIRIYHGGDTTAPWFTPANYVLTFVGCLILGQLFGRKTERRRELA